MSAAPPVAGSGNEAVQAARRARSGARCRRSSRRRRRRCPSRRRARGGDVLLPPVTTVTWAARPARCWRGTRSRRGPAAAARSGRSSALSALVAWPAFVGAARPSAPSSACCGDRHRPELRLVDLAAAERVVDDAVGGDAALLDVSAAERRGCVAGPAERREQRDERDDHGGGRTTDADDGTHENPPVLGGEPGAPPVRCVQLPSAQAAASAHSVTREVSSARHRKRTRRYDRDCGTGIRTPISRIQSRASCR